MLNEKENSFEIEFQRTLISKGIIAPTEARENPTIGLAFRIYFIHPAIPTNSIVNLEV
jgi:hypothetical protein